MADFQYYPEEVYHNFHNVTGPDNTMLEVPEKFKVDLDNTEANTFQPVSDIAHRRKQNLKSHDVNIKYCGNNWSYIKYWTGTEGLSLQDVAPLFCNTLISCDHANSEPDRSLLINVGESWCYGGQIRDMDLEYKESFLSLRRAFQHTMGSWMADSTQSDMVQFAYPGNNNTAMMRWLSDNLTELAHNTPHNKVYVVMQHTDHCREFFGGNHEELTTYKPMLDLLELDLRGKGDGNPNKSELLNDHTEFLETYWNIQWDWMEDILTKARLQTGKDIQAITWSNFFNIKFQNTGRSFKTVPISWNHFNQSIEGGELLDGDWGNTHFLNLLKTVCRNIDMDYVEEQVRYIESLHDWWTTSCHRGNLQPQYPSVVSHNIWALYLINQAGWLTYPNH